MGVMIRQREDAIQNGLVADAGDIDAELDHIVAQHNESEGRLVTAESDIIDNATDIAANAADIVDIQTEIALTQEIVAGSGTENYILADRENVTLYEGTGDIILGIQDPQAATVIGEVREIHNITDFALEVTLSTAGTAGASSGQYFYIAKGDILRFKCVDIASGGGTKRWAATLWKAVEQHRKVYVDSGNLGNITIAKEDLAMAYCLNEDGGTLALRLPTIDDALVGRRVVVANTGVTSFNVSGDGTQVCMGEAWTTGGFSGFALGAGKTVELMAMPAQTWEYSGGTLSTRYGWVAIGSN